MAIRGPKGYTYVIIYMLGDKLIILERRLADVFHLTQVPDSKEINKLYQIVMG